ncbi:MAG: DUF86 domain-containing protein [Clostridium sp.]|nr:DUF86 domain-containing protein [Clostridium sp.]
MSSNKRYRVCCIFKQIENAINQLKEWNVDVGNADYYYSSSSGMQKLAASCMLIEAIGESVRQIEKITGDALLSQRPEIPWGDIIGIRNHIAHGYFDIDGELVFNVIQQELDTLLLAVRFFIKTLEH